MFLSLLVLLAWADERGCCVVDTKYGFYCEWFKVETMQECMEMWDGEDWSTTSFMLEEDCDPVRLALEFDSSK